MIGKNSFIQRCHTPRDLIERQGQGGHFASMVDDTAGRSEMSKELHRRAKGS